MCSFDEAPTECKHPPKGSRNCITCECASELERGYFRVSYPKMIGFRLGHRVEQVHQHSTRCQAREIEDEHLGPC